MRTDSSLPLVYRAGFFGREALQAKAVGEDADRAESHGGSGDGGVEQKSGERVEDAGGDGDAEQVVAESPAQVLAHDAEGMAGEAESGDDLRRVAAQEDGVSGFTGKIGAGADGETGVGLGERGGVVDAVADHGDGTALGLEGADL